MMGRAQRRPSSGCRDMLLPGASFGEDSEAAASSNLSFSSLATPRSGSLSGYRISHPPGLSSSMTPAQLKNLSYPRGHLPPMMVAQPSFNRGEVMRRLAALDLDFDSKSRKVQRRLEDSWKSPSSMKQKLGLMASRMVDFGIFKHLISHVFIFVLYSCMVSTYAWKLEDWESVWSPVTQDVIYYPAMALTFLLCFRVSGCMDRYLQGMQCILQMEACLRNVCFEVTTKLRTVQNQGSQKNYQTGSDRGSNSSNTHGSRHSKTNDSGSRHSQSGGHTSSQPQYRFGQEKGDKMSDHSGSNEEPARTQPAETEEQHTASEPIPSPAAGDFRRRYFIHEFRRIAGLLFSVACRDLSDSACDDDDMSDVQLLGLPMTMTKVEEASLSVTHSLEGHALRVSWAIEWLLKTVKMSADEGLFHDDEVYRRIEGQLHKFKSAWLEAREIAYTSMSQSIDRFLWLLTTAMNLFMPWEWVSVCQWYTWIPSALLVLSFFGVLEIAQILENPFGFDQDDVPLNLAADRLDEEVCLIIKHCHLCNVGGENLYRELMQIPKVMLDHDEERC